MDREDWLAKTRAKMEAAKRSRAQFNAEQGPLIAKLTAEQCEAEIKEFAQKPGNSVHRCGVTAEPNLIELQSTISDIRWLQYGHLDWVRPGPTPPDVPCPTCDRLMQYDCYEYFTHVCEYCDMGRPEDE